MDQVANNPSLSALRQVMQQQQSGNAGVLSQNNPSASVPMQGPPQPQGSPMPQAAPAPTAPGMPSAQPAGQPAMPIGNPEADIILKAMSKRLDTISKTDLGQGGM